MKILAPMLISLVSIWNPNFGSNHKFHHKNHTKPGPAPMNLLFPSFYVCLFVFTPGHFYFSFIKSNNSHSIRCSFFVGVCRQNNNPLHFKSISILFVCVIHGQKLFVCLFVFEFVCLGLPINRSKC